MTNFFGNRGPVFAAIDATGSASPNIGTAVSSGGNSSGGTQGMFDSALSNQADAYGKGVGIEKETHDMQMYGDAALKALKAIQIG